MQQQQWKARWIEAGKLREFVFDSIDERVIARIDGRLRALAAGIRLPERFALEEIESKEDERWTMVD